MLKKEAIKYCVECGEELKDGNYRDHKDYGCMCINCYDHIVNAEFFMSYCDGGFEYLDNII